MQTQVNVHIDGVVQVRRDSIIGRPDKGVVRIGDVTIFGTIAQLDALLEQLAALRTGEVSA